MSETLPSSYQITAIKEVNVLPMDSERVLEAQTVIIKKGRISLLGPADEVQIPAGADVIEGGGGYLMPGLANMHAHLDDFDPDPDHLVLYLAGGVTTVRSLNTPWKLFKAREKITGGEKPVPTILFSGPAIVGFPREYRKLALGLRIALVLAIVILGALLLGLVYGAIRVFDGAELAENLVRGWGALWLASVTLAGIVAVLGKFIPLTRPASHFVPQAAFVETPAQARSEVRRQVKAGVDLVKPYDHLGRETYLAALAAAGEAGVYTAGHIPEDPEYISAEEALDAGLNETAHVDELTHEFLIDFDPDVREWVEWEIAMDRIDDIASRVADHKAAVTATLVTNETVLLGLEDKDELFRRPEYQYVRPEEFRQWRTRGRMVNWVGQERYRRGSLRPLWMALTHALKNKGVPILLGTDSGVEGIVPGFSEHRELALLVEAGFTPFEALVGATRDAAMITRRMGAEGDWGTVTIGGRADLILLADNPLVDVANVGKILGIMVRGRWLSKADLDRLVVDYINGQGGSRA